jgi:polar amino acid transport system substrate-binding protein
MRISRPPLLLAVPLLVAAVACAPVEEESDDPAAQDTASSESSASDSPSAEPDPCETSSLPLQEEGQLTVGTDSPAFEPWFSDNDPTNGKGFESAVAYAIAEELGFSEDQVTWVKVPFNTSYAPGEKDFDFDINQVSISPQRAEAVDFSDGYYSAAQALIALKDSDIADAQSLSELQDATIGAQTGTTSLTAVREVIAPTQDPLVFEDTNAAKQALNNDQVDAIVADLPTALYISAVEIPNSAIVGQFQVAEGQTEQFGMLFEKGSDLVPCVNEALAAVRDSGQLADIEERWVSDTLDVPVLE